MSLGADLAHVAPDHAPLPGAQSRPHTGVAIGALGELSANLYDKSRAERRHGDIRADAANAQLLRFVRAKAHRAGAMRREILLLRADRSIRTGE